MAWRGAIINKFIIFIFAPLARTAQSDKAEIIIFYLYFSPTHADSAECVYDGQQAREHTSVAELALA